MAVDFENDISAVQHIASVPTILDVICATTGMGFAAVARVTEDRWIACQVLDNINFGLPVGGELMVETTLCHEIRQHHNLVVIDNVAEDPIYSSHHTPATYGLQSYISAPIVLPDGTFFGTLCAIDPQPHRLNTPQTVATFKLFAELIAYHLDASDKLTTARTELLDATLTGELREQFIAVIGHDLRNPAASISSGMRVLLNEPQTEKAQTILALMRGSILRMTSLIDNLMDFARGRLGGGISLRKETGEFLDGTLHQVVSEIQSSHPDHRFITHINIRDDVVVDHERIGQLLSNLVGNAVTHGSVQQPVEVSAFILDKIFHISVTNGGNPVPESARGQLFQPFSRRAAGQQGLGLGLYIASQIAEAHNGHIEFSSDEEATTFTLKIPAQ